MIKNRKYKYSDRGKRFLITQDNENENTISSQSQKPKSKERKQFFKTRSKSREELNKLYLKHVKSVTEKYEKKIQKNPKKNIDHKRYIELKRCEECADFINDPALLLCEMCDDGYHMYCLDPPISEVPEGDFICPTCNLEMANNKIRQASLSKVIKRDLVTKVKRICNQCKEYIEEEVQDRKYDSPLQDNKNKRNSKKNSVNSTTLNSLKSCFKCRKDFHLKCFRKDSQLYFSDKKKKKQT